ncbi:DUF1287 domain-containing protein [Luteolibacter sp. AS25]|uniref:DUF1287 domain-containing protein n=1 Tax=Luteolibacter sp. AS25 TaxID=3135776 RepID=UPI00398AF052
MKIFLFFWLLTLGLCSGGTGEKIVGAAREQIGVTVKYDPAYVSMDYPGGDISRESGVCTDVVIRALRDGLEMDLQKLVHEDMKANFSKYPKIWGLSGTDKNIDHRRVPNLMAFFTRKHQKLPANSKFQPGDIVTCTVPPNLPHIMIVSDKADSKGLPLVIHNIGSGTREENRLQSFPMTGHYRLND